MSGESLADRIRFRADVAGINVADDALAHLVAYIEVLAVWNRRMNLTAFDLSVVGDAAIDRLVVEPLRAARLIRPIDRRVVDIGSGGGSPAVPLMIAVPAIEMTMVEVRVRKGAFLREVVRVLGVRASVEVCRAEEVAVRSPGVFDVVTFRGVRVDRAFWRVVGSLLHSHGRVLWFGGLGQIAETGYSLVDTVGETTALELFRPEP